MSFELARNKHECLLNLQLLRMTAAAIGSRVKTLTLKSWPIVRGICHTIEPSRMPALQFMVVRPSAHSHAVSVTNEASVVTSSTAEANRTSPYLSASTG